jgi:two-component system, LytTR family, sensor kinase
MTFDDRKIRMFGIPLLALLVMVTVHSLEIFAPAPSKSIFVVYANCLLNTLVIWEGGRAIMSYFINKYPHYSQTKYRMVMQSLTILLYLLVTTSFLDYFVCQLLLGDQATEIPFLRGFKISLAPTFIVCLIYETAFFFNGWKNYMMKTEALARANVQSQLDSLKSQLDPHFLFNSLNTLAALIDDTNADAQEYLSKLADVYRYVLVNREKNTVSIADEIAFIDAYVYLNKTRFRENLEVEMQVPKENYEQHIAPLSLQILIENAIKHNVISKDKPLKIKVLYQENYLIVQNNLQEKRILEQSTKVGLQNIKNRYQLLSLKPIEIEKTLHFFTVRLPILDYATR